MKSRIVILFVIVLGFWALLIFQAFQVQVLPDSRLQRLSDRQSHAHIKTEGRRGNIFDKKGRELATSIDSVSVFVDPSMIEKPRNVARILGKQLGLNLKTLKMDDKTRRFVWIARGLDESKVATLRKMDILGVGFAKEYKRIYPNGTAGAQILGFLDREGVGLEGLELQYNDKLKGLVEKRSVQKDAKGRLLLEEHPDINGKQAGEDLHLTLDLDLQHQLERILSEALAQHQAEHVSAVVLRANDSAILAMGSAPFPNEESVRGGPEYRNRSVTDMFESGSVIKPLILGGALASGSIKPNTKINCEDGTWTIPGGVIHESESNHKFGWITVNDILTFSSNIGMGKIAVQLGSNSVEHILRDWGFGQKTGADLPAEARGLIPSPPWKTHLLANIAFGHGVSVTLLQLANAYATIARGGSPMTPYILESGQPLTAPEAHKWPEHKMQLLTHMLVSAVSDRGTGKKSRLPDFQVAGKTGTAQKVSATGKGYASGQYIASFAGFLPAEAPKFVIVVSVDHPKVGGYYAGDVAAPIFARLAREAVDSDAIAPNGEKMAEAETEQKEEKPLTTNVLANLTWNRLTLREVMAKAQQEGLDVQVVGSGVVNSFRLEGKKLRVYMNDDQDPATTNR